MEGGLMDSQKRIINQINYQLQAIAKCGFVPQHFPPEPDDLLNAVSHKDYLIFPEYPNGGMTCISIMPPLGGTWFSFPCGMEEVQPFFDHHEADKAIAWCKEVIDKAIEESEFAESVVEESY
jgi:hypothetical protein